MTRGNAQCGFEENPLTWFQLHGLSGQEEGGTGRDPVTFLFICCQLFFSIKLPCPKGQRSFIFCLCFILRGFEGICLLLLRLSTEENPFYSRLRQALRLWNLFLVLMFNTRSLNSLLHTIVWRDSRNRRNLGLH